MGPSYSAITTFFPPFSQISIDLLAFIEVKTIPGSRKTRKVYPLVIANLNFKAIHIEIPEAMSGSDVAFGLLSLQ